MDNLAHYSSRPFALVARYIRSRFLSHFVIITAVTCAVVCSVGTQYGVKNLVDSLASQVPQNVWRAFLLLVTLIAADNLLWRLATWIASGAFVNVTGDLRRDLF